MTVHLRTLPASLKNRVRQSRPAFGLDVPVERKGRFAVSAKEDRTIGGRVFDSKKEATRYAELKNLERAGLIECVELQPTWNVEIAGRHYCKYTCDFSYVNSDTGLPVLEEVKSSGSAKDDAYKLRRKAAELMHGLKITEVIR